MENIKAVVFDFGGVIRLNDNGNILEGIGFVTGIPYAKLKKAYYERNFLSNVQNLSWEDLAVRTVQEFDKSPETERRVREFVRAHNEKNYINTDLLTLFPLLRHAGLKVAILTNATTDLRNELKERGISEMVDDAIISGEIGFQKPQRGAFEVLFKKLGVRPHEVIFIDDSEKSLESAPTIGYIPILFKNNAQLKAELHMHLPSVQL